MVTNLNQVRHLYVVNAETAKTAIDKLTEKGDYLVKATTGFDKEVYLAVKGYDTVLKSDYIPVKSIVDAKATKASAMATVMKKVVVKLSADVNEGLPIVGQDYILRINLRQFYGMSDQDQYFKDAAVHATKSMTTALAFYQEMVDALNKSFSREIGATKNSNPYLTFSYDANGITIEEKPQTQDWSLGTHDLERVYFDVVPTTVYDGTDDLIWGTTTVSASTTKVGNGRNIANLEYFLLGERGDQYRKIGWPNDIETKGLVDASTDYDVLDIHYSFSGSGVNSYKTEKDLTIVAPTSTDHTIINAVITSLNTATGLTIATLSADA